MSIMTVVHADEVDDGDSSWRRTSSSLLNFDVFEKKKEDEENHPLLSELSHSRVVIVKDWDDGHIPEHCQGIPTTLVWRPDSWHSQSRVHIQDNALPPDVVDAIYDRTVQEGRPWGTYVTMKQVRPLLQELKLELDQPPPPTELGSSNNNNNNNNNNESPASITMDHIAAQACAWYLHRARQASFLMLDDDDRDLSGDDGGGSVGDWHGIAVWALPAQVGSQVPYHVDYAEQVRYQHNVLVFPLLAGTLHCTQSGGASAAAGCDDNDGGGHGQEQKEPPPVQQEVQGGALRIFLNKKSESRATTATTTGTSSSGLEHYEKHGYKACKCPVIDNDNDDNEGTTYTIDYCYNRLIIMSGHLPHASTSITSLPPNKQRVILGFNAFGHDVGHLVEAAPEHSAKWRKQIKLLQLEKQILLRMGQQQQQQQPNQSNQQQQQQTKQELSSSSFSLQQKHFTLASVEQNPALRKFLVQAKRQRVKEEWRRQYLHERIHEVLQLAVPFQHASEQEQPAEEQEQPAPAPRMTVAELVEQLERRRPKNSNSSSWPTAQDILEYLKSNNHSSSSSSDNNDNNHPGKSYYYRIDDDPVTLESTIRLVSLKS